MKHKYSILAGTKCTTGRWVRLRLKVSKTRGRRPSAQILAPSTKVDHVMLDRPLDGMWEHPVQNLEVVGYDQ